MSSPSLPWQHGTRQEGWYISGTMRKLPPNITKDVGIMAVSSVSLMRNEFYISQPWLEYKGKKSIISVEYLEREDRN